MFSFSAIPNIAYLFLKHSPFNWNQIKYGYFLALYITVPSFFLLCITPLLKTKFDFKDTTLWIISIVSSSLGDVWFGYSTEDWMVYLGNIDFFRFENFWIKFIYGCTICNSILYELVFSFFIVSFQPNLIVSNLLLYCSRP